MNRKIIFTIAALLTSFSLQAIAADASGPATEQFVPAQAADATADTPADGKETGLSAKPAAQDTAPAPTPAVANPSETAPLQHRTARDNQTDYRYCLDLKTDAEIAACRYKK